MTCVQHIKTHVGIRWSKTLTKALHAVKGSLVQHINCNGFFQWVVLDHWWSSSSFSLICVCHVINILFLPEHVLSLVPWPITMHFCLRPSSLFPFLVLLGSQPEILVFDVVDSRRSDIGYRDSTLTEFIIELPFPIFPDNVVSLHLVPDTTVVLT